MRIVYANSPGRNINIVKGGACSEFSFNVSPSPYFLFLFLFRYSLFFSFRQNGRADPQIASSVGNDCRGRYCRSPPCSSKLSMWQESCDVLLTSFFSISLILMSRLSFLLIGSVIVFQVLKKLRQNAARASTSQKHKNISLILCLLTCFSGGVFLGTCFLHLLPELSYSVTKLITDYNVSFTSSFNHSFYDFSNPYSSGKCIIHWLNCSHAWDSSFFSYSRRWFILICSICR